MIYPTISINGTHPDTLIDAISKAFDVLYVGYMRLEDCSPNARDYSADDYKVAVAEHTKRVTVLRNLILELNAIRENVCDQKDSRL